MPGTNNSGSWKKIRIHNTGCNTTYKGILSSSLPPPDHDKKSLPRRQQKRCSTPTPPPPPHHHPGVCITVPLLPSTGIVKKKKMITALARPQYRFYSCLGQMDFPRFLEDFFWKTPDADPVPVGFFWSVLRCRAFFMNSRVSINSGSLRQL